MVDSPIITCPECKKKFKGKGQLQGKKIKCPFCAKPFQVAGKDEKATAAAAAASSGPVKPTTWTEGDDDSNPYDVTAIDLKARCPNCANPMESEEAIICLICGYNTLTRQWGKTDKVIGTTRGEHFIHLLPGIACAVGILLCVVLLLFLSLALPGMVKRSWASFLDHESMRLWISSIILLGSWWLGMVAFKRLIVHPKPEEERKD